MKNREPVSLKAPEAESAAARRAYAAVTSTSPPSDPGDGYGTRMNRYIHGLVEVTAGTSIDFQVWLYNAFHGHWYLDTRLGTDGTVTVAAGGDDEPYGFILEINAAQRVALRFLNPVDGGTADAWLGSNG